MPYAKRCVCISEKGMLYLSGKQKTKKKKRRKCLSSWKDRSVMQWDDAETSYTSGLTCLTILVFLSANYML